MNSQSKKSRKNFVVCSEGRAPMKLMSTQLFLLRKSVMLL